MSVVSILDHRQLKLLRTVVLALMAMPVPLAVAGAVMRGYGVGEVVFYLMFTLAGAAFGGFGLFLAIKGHLLPAARATCIWLALGLGMLTWVAPGDIRLDIFQFLTLPLVVAGLFLPERDTWAVAAACLGWTFGAIGWLEVPNVELVNRAALVGSVGILTALVARARSAAEQEAIALTRLLNVCSWCRNAVQDTREAGWMAVGEYIEKKEAGNISHGICDDCTILMNAELDQLDAVTAPTA